MVKNRPSNNNDSTKLSQFKTDEQFYSDYIRAIFFGSKQKILDKFNEFNGMIDCI